MNINGPRRKKTCLQGLHPPPPDSNKSPQLQRLASKLIGNKLEVMLDMTLSNKSITKSLIRLRNAQAGLHLCYSQTPKAIFSRVYAHTIIYIAIIVSYRANAKNRVISTIMSYFWCTIAGVNCYCKMASVMALDGVASFLRLKDVTITC